MGHASPWTEAVDETARVSWTAGDSASICVGVIHEQHGIAVTRNAVIGRAHRQKWETPTKPQGLSGAAAVRKARSSRNYAGVKAKGNQGALAMRMRAAQQPKFPKDTRPSNPDTTESRNMTLLDLEPHQCRYPTSPDDVTSHLFCGAPKAEGSSYCVAHHAMCYGRHAGGARPRRYFPRLAPVDHMSPAPSVQEEATLPHGKTFSEHSGSSV